MPSVSSERLKAKAAKLGFNLVGVIPAQPAPTLDAYFRWVDAGMHGTMGYMARPDRQERRRDLNMILPGVRAMVVCGVDYRTEELSAAVLEDPSRGRFARYAWGDDYHDVLTPRLETLAEWLDAEAAGPGSHRVYVDTGAILERAHAQQAGLGFIGKNTMLINQRRGSDFFLAEILTTVEFDTYDAPAPQTMCGSCTRCLRACPTAAFPQPYVLDARRCISALTIEHKGWIDPALRPLMGNWVYGCDICQDVCPWQRFAIPTHEPAFFRENGLTTVAPLLLDLLALDEMAFRAWYAGTPIIRIRRHRLVRNACIAAGNWGDATAVPALTRLLDDPEPLVRGHAAWALIRITGQDIHRTLKRRLARESDSEVRAEWTRLLGLG